MRSYVQMSLSDTYENVAASISEKKPELISLLEQHIDFDGLIKRLSMVVTVVHINTIWKVLSVL